ncbi:PepSY domain-containing protein [Hyphococcus sp.]|uniref:PepSY domain-containing protein n=1 Tax=Hyphococcus sp. TaxID=2038636 RepID=UPI00208886BB|nr:MAG: hypothetical protein DHS20C04_27840 [Marinicaulis sp.]
MTVKAIVQRVHLWAGLLLGVQVLLWMASGAVMSVFPIELVRGETSMFVSEPIALEPETYASPGGIIAQTEGATSVELRRFMGRPVYLARRPGGAAMFDASTGEKITPLKEAQARRVAEQDYVGEGKIVRATLMNNPPHEYRGATPVWRLDMSDKLHTRIYVLPDTGEVRARRNDVWRVYDFFWMLHIMDYKDRENFNNPLVITAAVTGLIFSISGIWIVILRLGRGRYHHDLMLATGRHRRKSETETNSTDA